MRICSITLIFTVVSLLVVSNTSAGELVLAENGKSSYQIVVADNASPSTKYGAQELQKFLEQMTGAKLLIVSDQQPKRPKEIILGNNAHLQELGVAIDFAALGKEGYVIRTVGERLVIAGGQVRGNMYGVYGFLEDHLGCRWFTPDVCRIPKYSRLAIRATDDRQIPALEYRDLGLADCLNGDWCARNRLNGSHAELQERHGGQVIWGGGLWCHTFAILVPPEKYFNEHPEYFSLVAGKRLKKNSQLCCTNPDVIRICTEGVRKAMRLPNVDVASVSQNDYHNHCECANCQAIAKKEGSEMGPVLYLVNRVAEGVEKEFPDKFVETLAYHRTRRPPKQMRPRSNVIIRLCSIECCFSHPLATCNSPLSKAFCEEIDAWAKVAPRLWVWNYGTDFINYLLPMPNQRVRGPNIRFFVDHNVKGIFEQDTTTSKQSELAELGGYVTAKCLWNPSYDWKKAMSEFLEAYYGKAAGPIRAYIDLLHDRVERENIHVGVWFDAIAGAQYVPGAEFPLVGPESKTSHLSEDFLTAANGLWQQAEDVVSNEPELLKRVKTSRLSVDYAILERGRLQALGKLPANKTFTPLVVARFHPFLDVIQKSAITRIDGWEKPFDSNSYRRDLARDLRIEP